MEESCCHCCTEKLEKQDPAVPNKLGQEGWGNKQTNKQKQAKPSAFNWKANKGISSVVENSFMVFIGRRLLRWLCRRGCHKRGKELSQHAEARCRSGPRTHTYTRRCRAQEPRLSAVPVPDCVSQRAGGLWAQPGSWTGPDPQGMLHAPSCCSSPWASSF